MTRTNVRIDGARVIIAGRIDDGSSFEGIAARLPGGRITIDTSDVTFVNSVGMREWIRFLRALRAEHPVTLERVADVLMTQMNMIRELAGSVQISSFHAQYVCASCGHESAPVVDAIANADALRALKAPKLPCPECGAAMDLGDFPERYLSIFR